MKILFTFPGQGNQRPDMLAALPDRQNILAEARTVLGDEVDHIDTAAALKHTRAVQLCLLIAGTAWARELQRQGVNPDMVSGLSIGAFPAAVIAGALDFTDALRLVALRGDLMEQAYPHGYGLTAIMGLTLDRVEKLIADSDLYIANLNAETQIVIAGTTTRWPAWPGWRWRLAPVKHSGWRSAYLPTARCWMNRRLSWQKRSLTSRCSARAAPI